MGPTDDYARRLALGTVINGTGAVLGVLLDLAAVGVLFRRLGPDAYGVVVLAQSLALWPYILESGIGYATVRMVSRRAVEPRLGPLISTAALAYAALAVLSVALGFLIGLTLLEPVFDVPKAVLDDATVAFCIISVAAGLRMLETFAKRVLVGDARLASVRIVEITRDVATFGFIVLLVGDGALIAAAWALLLGDVAATAVCIVFAARAHPAGLLVVPDRDARRQVWSESRTVLAVSGVGLAWSRIDPFIVGIALGTPGAAVYGVVSKAYGTLQALAELLVTGLMPASARVGVHIEDKAMGRLFRRVLGVCAAAVWPAAAVAIVFREPIITRWLHVEPSGIGAAWWLAMLLAVVAVPATTASVVVAGANRLGEVLRLQIVLATLNVAIGIALVSTIEVAAVYLGSIVATVLITPRQLAITSHVTQTPVRDLVGDLQRVAALVAGATTAFVAIRASGVGDAVALALVAAVMVGYAALLAAWVIPRDEIRRLLGRLSRA